MSDDATPLASGRIRMAKYSSASHIPHRPIKSTNSRSVKWDENSQSDHSPTERSSKLSSSDILGRLSVAQNTINKLKEQVAMYEDQLEELKEEKEKYEENMGKVYSQMSAVRNKCQAYEQQISKRGGEKEALEVRVKELESEVIRLKSLYVEDAGKYGQKIKSLELQNSALKCENENLQSINASLKENSPSQVKSGGRDAFSIMKTKYEAQISKIAEKAQEIQDINDLLNNKLEEARNSLLKMSTEKTSLHLELKRLKDEQKKVSKIEKRDAQLEEDLHMRLAELETERSNAKTALKKAMAVLDQEEELRRQLAEKDQLIEELQLQIETSKLKSTLPSIEYLNNSIEKLSMENDQSEIAQRLRNLAPSNLPSDLKEIPRSEQVTFAAPLPPSKSQYSDGVKTRLSAIQEANSRLKELAANVANRINK